MAPYGGSRMSAAAVGGEGSKARVRRLWLSSVGISAAKLLERRGGVSLKLAQVLSTRADVLPPEVTEQLRRLQDAVRPMPLNEVERILAAAYPGCLSALFEHIDLAPIASGSVAQVHRAVLAGTHRLVVLKLRRRTIRSALDRDVRLVRRVGHCLSSLPGFADIPFREALDAASEALANQADFSQEARHHREAGAYLAGNPQVTVPNLVRPLCRTDVLVMDYVSQATPLGSHASDRVNREATVLTVRALYGLLFDRGLIHCDLHPGNVLVRADGTVALIDFGYVAKLSPQVRQQFAEFFLSLVLGDGHGAARIAIDMASSRSPRFNESAFNAEVRALVENNTRRVACEFTIVGFVTALFAIQRRHGLRASPAFTGAILGLLALEGTVRRVCPGLDFQREALPFVIRAANGGSLQTQ